MRVRIIFLLLIALLLSGSLYAQNNKSYQIIVNESNTLSSIGINQLSKIFLKKVTLWDDGSKIQPVDLKSNSKIRRAFSIDVHGKSVEAINAYWQKQIFSGRGVPPPEKRSYKEVITYVENNPGAIGYISKNTKVTNVIVIKVTD